MKERIKAMEKVLFDIRIYGYTSEKEEKLRAANIDLWRCLKTERDKYDKCNKIRESATRLEDILKEIRGSNELPTCSQEGELEESIKGLYAEIKAAKDNHIAVLMMGLGVP